MRGAVARSKRRYELQGELHRVWGRSARQLEVAVRSEGSASSANQNNNLVFVAIQCVAEAAHAVPHVTVRIEDDVVATGLTFLRVVSEEAD